MVLSTSVGYNTQKASLPLTADQRKEADRLGEQAQQQNRARQYADAMRSYQEGMAVMHKVPWTPSVELASSLRGRVDHAMLESGRRVTVSLAPLYPTENANTAKITASVLLRPAVRGAAAGKTLAGPVAIDPAGLPFTAQVTIPQTENGDYDLEVRLSLADGSSPADLRAAFFKDVPVHIESLSAEAQKLGARLAAFSKRDDPALPTAQFVLAHYEQSDNGEASPLRYNFREEFAHANAILDVIEAGRKPFAGKSGDFHRAYLSKVDRTLQPYRIFVPNGYDASKPTPLVVALHGMGGDENSMFSGYDGVLEPAAQKHGFIVVCPKGRQPASMYRGSAEQDVMDVIVEVRRDYDIDASRIYLMGHSMGGYGTWSVAMDHPDLFAAIGPISGGGDINGMVKIKTVPEYVVHGNNDKTVNVEQSRRMVEAGKKIGVPITYVEVPGGSHVSVAAPHFAPMLDFFAKQAKAAAAGAQ